MTLRWFLLAYVLTNAALYSALLPLWEGFDEPFHFGYVQYLANGNGLPDPRTSRLSKEGSAQECVETGISGCFGESDKFGSGHGHALRLQQEVMQVFVAAPTSQQTFDIAVHRFHDTHRHFGAAIVEDPIQMIH